MSLVVKQIRTWRESKEDFNKGTFVLGLKTGSLWIYLQGKQGLLKWAVSRCKGTPYQSFFERVFQRKLTKTELKAGILQVQRSAIGQNKEKKSSSRKALRQCCPGGRVKQALTREEQRNSVKVFGINNLSELVSVKPESMITYNKKIFLASGRINRCSRLDRNPKLKCYSVKCFAGVCVSLDCREQQFSVSSSWK